MVHAPAGVGEGGIDIRSFVLATALLAAALAARHAGAVDELPRQSASAVDELPRKAGMSPEQVRAITAFGPYSAFSNGDLETYKGRRDGRDENVQFHFKDGKLARASIYFYEGADPADAVARWLALRRSMAQHFGPLEAADVAAASHEAFQADAQAAVAQGACRPHGARWVARPAGVRRHCTAMPMSL